MPKVDMRGGAGGKYNIISQLTYGGRGFYM